MLAVSVSFLIAACSETVQGSTSPFRSDAPPPAPTGFLGNDYSLLKPGEKGQALLVYLNPDAQWSQYNKILLEPAEFWDSSDSKVSPADQQMLTSYFNNVLKEELEKKGFAIVDQGGPGVIELQVALINTTTATPVLRSVSVVIPQVRVLNSLQSLGTGSYAFVGSAEGAMKATDSQTGQMLGEAMDERKGGMALATAAQWKWGDAENAMNFWATQIATRLQELKSGGTNTASAK